MKQWKKKAAGQTGDTAVKKAGKAKEKKEKKVRVKRADCRVLMLSAMYLFVAFVMIWGTVQMVRNINTAGREMDVREAKEASAENNSKNKKIDTESLAKMLLKEISFEGDLKKLDDSVASGMLNHTEGTELQFYTGNGTHADEVVVMAAASEADAEKNQQYAQAYLTDKKASFQDYIPEEADKIDDAVCVRSGNCVIVCVTKDYAAAKKVIEGLME